MIRYNKRITVKETKYGKKLETDRGDNYELMAISSENNQTPVTSWWDKQAQTGLRRDQLDYIVKEYWRQNSPLELFLVYKRGEGYSQPHDILLAYDNTKEIWILSTQEHTWFVKGGDDVVFNADDAMGSITNHDARLEIYEVIDGITQ
jgi:hypothetical protein